MFESYNSLEANIYESTIIISEHGEVYLPRSSHCCISLNIFLVN